jgi:hypothetical protein
LFELQEITRRLKRAVVKYLWEQGEYNPETKHLGQKVKDILPPRDYEDKIINKMVNMRLFSDQLNNIDGMKKKISR